MMKPLLPLRVIKLGGSLLAEPDLRNRFNSWLGQQSPAVNLLVTGGGECVEAIRQLDAIHRLDQVNVHWLCVDLMASTAKLASELLGSSSSLATTDELQDFLVRNRVSTDSLSNPLACVQPAAYYTRATARYGNCPLPESWDCTSDSIAAWLAHQYSAEQLVLLKSTSAERNDTPAGPLNSAELQRLATHGIIDPMFPVIARGLADVRIVNLQAGH